MANGSTGRIRCHKRVEQMITPLISIVLPFRHLFRPQIATNNYGIVFSNIVIVFGGRLRKLCQVLHPRPWFHRIAASQHKAVAHMSKAQRIESCEPSSSALQEPSRMSHVSDYAVISNIRKAVK